MCIAAAPAPLQLYLFVSCICLDLLCVHLLGGVLCCICAETVRRRAVVEVLMNAPEGHAPAQNDTAATTNSSAGPTATTNAQQEEYGVLDKKLEFWRANIKSKSPKPAELLVVYYIAYI